MPYRDKKEAVSTTIMARTVECDVCGVEKPEEVVVDNCRILKQLPAGWTGWAHDSGPNKKIDYIILCDSCVSKIEKTVLSTL